MAHAADRGEVHKTGFLKNPLKLGVLAHDFRHVIQPQNPILRRLGTLFGIFGRAAGYSDWYRADVPESRLTNPP